LPDGSGLQVNSTVSTLSIQKEWAVSTKASQSLDVLKERDNIVLNDSEGMTTVSAIAVKLVAGHTISVAGDGAYAVVVGTQTVPASSSKSTSPGSGPSSTSISGTFEEDPEPASATVTAGAVKFPTGWLIKNYDSVVWKVLETCLMTGMLFSLFA